MSTHPYLSLSINICLSRCTFPSPPPPSFPHPPIILCPSASMDEWWYSRGIVEEESFPGPVASSQIMHGTCSDHLALGSLMKRSHRNSFFCCHFILVHTFPVFTVWTLFITLTLLHFDFFDVLQSLVQSVNINKLLPKLNICTKM